MQEAKDSNLVNNPFMNKHYCCIILLKRKKENQSYIKQVFVKSYAKCITKSCKRYCFAHCIVYKISALKFHTEVER